MLMPPYFDLDVVTMVTVSPSGDAGLFVQFINHRLKFGGFAHHLLHNL
jgi:hypothetical protein